jgi:hypothetical protein
MVALRKLCSSHTAGTIPDPCCACCIVAIALLGLLGPGWSHAADESPSAGGCLPQGGGYLKAKLAGAIDAELDWDNARTECSGSTRPNGGGLRIVFRRPAATDGEAALVLLFGIADVTEGESARAVPANLTIIREGTGEFYGTQGDERCYVDELTQEPLAGIPLRQRAYRVVARGFCMQPARAIQSEGSILVPRFDFAGRIDFGESDPSSAESIAERQKNDEP